MSHLVSFSVREMPTPVPGCRAFRLGPCFVLVGVEAGLWHLSISHTDRYPTWDEIKEARYRFVPDAVTMAMLLPPRREYVNIHPNCFHLHELPVDGVKGQP